jgi:hypothetical protein
MPIFDELSASILTPLRFFVITTIDQCVDSRLMRGEVFGERRPSALLSVGHLPIGVG